MSTHHLLRPIDQPTDRHLLSLQWEIRVTNPKKSAGGPHVVRREGDPPWLGLDLHAPTGNWEISDRVEAPFIHATGNRNYLLVGSGMITVSDGGPCGLEV